MKTNKLPALKTQWKPSLHLYSSRKALAFASRRDRDRLLAALWSDLQLYGMPRDYAGALLLIVPEPAVALLRKKGFMFTVRDTVTA